MKNKLLPLLILAVFFIVGVIGYFIFLSKEELPTPLPLIGNSPSYKGLSSCPEMAQFVIKERKLLPGLIHSCKSSKTEINKEEFYVVEISYGAAQDCPAGCFYDSFVGAVPKNKSEIIGLPGSGDSKNGMLTTVSLPHYDSGKVDFKCSADLDSITEMKLGKDDNRVGWQLSFSKPYSCSWKEVKSTKVLMDNTFVNTADEITRSWEGSMFVFLQDKNIQWNLDKLTTKEIGRKEVIFEQR